MTRDSYLDASQEAGIEFYRRGIKGEVVMLNLLKFAEVADYSQSPKLANQSPRSGQEAYQLYMDHTMPFLEKAGSEVLFYGKAGPFLIGPAAEDWDAVLLVKHASVAAFMEFAQNEEYLKGVGHRNAALVDSRLLPIEELSFP
ncbi:DUF1330 domain-containing protein [Membranihabitans marinus]|uniref:DUF1330 domain-containing protein n=1 Tax=Membranihabitans marinus TaxID=1227546 RepID=UPI001F3E0770|nr:DUF1330 domain-containing protein [Membranihabitans marinus]